MPKTHFAAPGRDNNFHLIRHLAALAVVVTHSYAITTGSYAEAPLGDILEAPLGRYGVDVFFVLSGFLIAQSLSLNPDPLRFAVSRVLRIFPALVFAVLATALVLGPLVTDRSWTQYFTDPALAAHIAGAVTTLATALPLPGVFDGLPEAGAVNTPLWTLKYELAAYATVAVVFFLSLAIRRGVLLLPAILGIVVLLGLATAALPASLDSGAARAAHLLLAFFLGSAGWLLRRHLPLSPFGAVAFLLAAVAASGTPAAGLTEKLFIAYGVLWLAFIPGLPTRRLEHLGDGSYGLYIYAFPIQQTLRLAFPEIEPLALFALAVALTVPLAFASWHLLERPCLDARDGILAALARFGALTARPRESGNPEAHDSGLPGFPLSRE